MGIMGGHIGHLILRKVSPKSTDSDEASHEELNTKLVNHFGQDFYRVIHGKTVIDFGCGSGSQAVEMAMMGAGKVIGLDIQDKLLISATNLAKINSVSDHCIFSSTTKELADVIISKDAFEHFYDPAIILRAMYALLKSDGFVLCAFGPTWLHPYGGHLFSIFPWAHLIFTEHALIRWRSDFKFDGASRFSEVAGGLNKLTIRKFRQIVNASPLKFEWLETVPIKGINILKSKLLREFGSSIIRCKLVPR
jgi:SAM-dependent methyltransferase